MLHARRRINPENVQQVIDGMYGVVNEGGTGTRPRLPNIEVCGKTGTAQLASNEIPEGRKAATATEGQRLVRGFRAAENPEIVVVALFENGEHGISRAPIVRDVMKAYFDKKARGQRQSA